MANAGGIRAGAAYVELYAQDNKLVRGLQAAERADEGESITFNQTHRHAECLFKLSR